MSTSHLQSRFNQGVALSVMLDKRLTEFYKDAQTNALPLARRPLHDGIHWIEVHQMGHDTFYLHLLRFSTREGMGLSPPIEGLERWHCRTLSEALDALRVYQDKSDLPPSQTPTEEHMANMADLNDFEAMFSERLSCSRCGTSNQEPTLWKWNGKNWQHRCQEAQTRP